MMSHPFIRLALLVLGVEQKLTIALAISARVYVVGHGAIGFGF